MPSATKDRSASDNVMGALSNITKQGQDAVGSLTKQGQESFSSMSKAGQDIMSKYGVSTQPLQGMDAWKKFSAVTYTANPFKLFLQDMGLLIKEGWSLPFVILPLMPFNSKGLDELYPSPANLWCGFVHAILSTAQLIFLGWGVTALFLGVPINIYVISVVGFFITNYYLCEWFLNGGAQEIESSYDFANKHPDERWIFLNGVSVGKHWLQGNLDRLSLTFGRKVVGCHNPTSGVVFDVLQCLIQRDFTYATSDIRAGHAILKRALGSTGEQYKKVILILHSQGGIEGGLILDWLLAELPAEQLVKLEIYTFGNAANHFNNPNRALPEPVVGNGDTNGAAPTKVVETRAVKYIEHYANRYDTVARIGVLHFAGQSSEKTRNNRFAGQVFERDAKGHMLNQHYLDQMFPLNKNILQGASEDNVFMNTVVIETQLPEHAGRENPPQHCRSEDLKVIVRNLTLHDSMHEHDSDKGVMHTTTHTVGEVSRLWQYRNGRSPKD